jgi:20S proteasome alpha/beta subunit
MLALKLLVALATYQYGGTFIGAVICSDGIVVASDSRTTFMDGEGNAFAYLDGMPKIFVNRDAAVAISGMSSLDGELFSSFARRNDDLLNRPVNDVLFDLLLHMPFTPGNNIAMLSAGFIDGKPMICSKPPIAPQTCSVSGFFTSKTAPLLRQAFESLNRPPTVAEAAVALKADIEKASATDRGVGGSIIMLRLSNNAPPQWLAGPPSDGGAEKICDLVRNRRAEIVPLVAQSSLDLHLKAACPK